MTRHEVILAGTGGKGVLLAGQLLAQAGLERYPYVVWTPTYFTLMRAGPSECTVILSQEPIASPLLSRAQVVVVFEPSQFQDFLPRVVPGGTLIAESAGLPPVARNDLRLLPVAATEIAAGLGNIQGANFVLLGAYLGVSKALPLALIRSQIESRFQNSPRLQEVNIQALERGLGLAG